MPIHGRGWGTDSSDQLRTLPWANIRAWRPDSPPTFAGRYFFHPVGQGGDQLGHVWVNGEAAGVRQGQGHNLAYVAPLQAFGWPLNNQGQHQADQTNRLMGRRPNPVHPEQLGAVEPDHKVVQGWGDADGKKICDTIVQVVGAGDLEFPFLPSVIVYLDIEPGVSLSADYWYGWASRVYWYTYVSIAPPFLHLPFYPGIYCTTDSADPHPDVFHHRIPSTDVRGALTGGPNNLASRCYGVWAANPVHNSTAYDPATMHNWSAQGFEVDWQNRFDTGSPGKVWQQTVHVIFGHVEWHTGVPVRLWQYAPDLNALNVDLNESSPDVDAVGWMMKLP